MHTLEDIKRKFHNHLEKENFKRVPVELYEPIEYLISIGGKRVRPLLLLLACDMFDGKIEDAIHPALGIEIFHNFTLVHDDIMDNAAIRRGLPTLHKKWNTNVAILSGDTMFALAYQYLIRTNHQIAPEITDIFTKMAIEVCEGQQYDMNFETKENVTIDEYTRMIHLKTAITIASSLKIGAMIAGANPLNAKNLYNFGINIGIAFQIMDDLLDLYAEKEKLGKTIGGDIIANKKTFLYIKGYELANIQQRQELDKCFKEKHYSDADKVKKVKEIYDNLDIKNVTKNIMQEYYDNALKKLYSINIPDERIRYIKSFTDHLMKRNF